MIGTTISHYRITAKLGEGGMGKVYRAHDERLDRDVAIKVLPEEVAQDEARLARFEREAKLLASLSHQNIATLHGLEEHEGQRFLVMELAEGESLADRIKKGPILVDDVLPIALQIAEGLEAAHEQGIIHRDLKPANVMLSPEGKVKVLDFGLAKAWAPEESDDNLTESPTLTAQMTAAGVLLGTAAYMSPEQARGKPVDKRADIWAFGCVLYEMLTGERLFTGDTVSDVLAAVLRQEPDLEALPSGLPPRFRWLVTRCLDKDPRNRLQHIGEARIALDAKGIQAGDDPSLSPKSAARNMAWIAAAGITALIVGVLIGGIALRNITPVAETPKVLHLPVWPGEDVELLHLWWPSLAISPDGSRLAFAGTSEGRRGLFLLDLKEGGDARQVRSSDLGEATFFSPDGKWLGFAAGTSLLKIPIAGGEPEVVAKVLESHPGASWSPDGSILFAPRYGSGILRVPSTGGDPQPITVLANDTDAHVYPQILPGGDTVLYSIGKAIPQIAVTSLQNGTETIIQDNAFYARFVPTGHLLFAQRDTLMAMLFDPETLAAGTPVPVLDNLVTNHGEAFAEYAVSDGGTLAYFEGPSELERWLVRLAPGQAPERLHRHPIPADHGGLRISPDGRRLALSLKGTAEVWTFDLERTELDHRLASGNSWNFDPIWSADGSAVTFISDREGDWGFFSRTIEGVGEPERLLISSENKWPGSWSPDGRVLAYTREDPQVGSDLWIATVGHEVTTRPFISSPAWEFGPVFSPDGRWIGFHSNESGQWEAYVASYPEPDIRRKISSGGGQWTRWQADGSRIFYLAGDSVMVVDVVDDVRFVTSKPEVFVTGVDPLGASWDVAPDGSHVIALERRAPPRLRVILNWFEELKRLVPTE
jgi:serine/threonine-protein kinase